MTSIRTALAATGILLLVGCGDSQGLAVDAWSRAPDPNAPNPTGNTNVNFGGAQDFGYVRRLLEANQVPRVDEIDDAGFFAEHHTPLPEPDCGGRVCPQAMIGVMGNLINGENCTMLQVGLNSPVTIDPESRPPLTLAVVVDVSGSMADAGKMDFVKLGLEQMVNELYDDDRIAIITYSTNAHVVFDMAEVRDNRNALRDVVRRLNAVGSTNLWGGLELGYEAVLADYDSARQNRVILLSDGRPTAGVTGTNEILEQSRPYNSDGVGLTTVGLGTSFNLDLMRSLAEQGDGNFYFVENAAAVDEVFTEELDYFTVPVAFDLELDITAGADYRFRGAFGSRLFEHDLTSGSLSLPSVFLAHRTSHDDVTDEGGRRGGGSALLLELMPNEDDGSNPDETEVAKVSLSYRVPGETERVQQDVAVVYPHAPWELLEAGYFDNEIVTKSFVMLNILVGMRTASEHFYMGNGGEGITVLRQLIAAVRDYEEDQNDGEGDVDMQLDIELMELMVSVLIANGAQDPEAPLREDPWPAD